MNAETALYRLLRQGLAGTATVARDVPADVAAALPLVTLSRTGGSYDGITDRSTVDVTAWAQDEADLAALGDELCALCAGAADVEGGFTESAVEGVARAWDAARDLPRWTVTASVSYED